MTNVEVSAPRDSNRPGGGLFWTLRIMVTLQAVALIGQAVFAGMLLEGQSRALHGMGSTAVHLFGLLQLVAAILVWRPGRGTARYILPSTLLLVFGVAQSAAGGAGSLYAHIPLGALLLGGSLMLVTVVWSRPPS